MLACPNGSKVFSTLSVFTVAVLKSNQNVLAHAEVAHCLPLHDQRKLGRQTYSRNTNRRASASENGHLRFKQTTRKTNNAVVDALNAEQLRWICGDLIGFVRIAVTYRFEQSGSIKYKDNSSAACCIVMRLLQDAITLQLTFYLSL